jgi:hypothetical protein
MSYDFTPVPREQIYQALFTLIAGASVGGSPVFKTTGRRLQGWSQVAAEEKPAFYQLQAGEKLKRDPSGIPYVTRLHAEIYLFVEQTDNSPTSLISPLLNVLKDAVIAALQASAADERQTLGDLVYDVRLSDFEDREGLMGPNAYTVGLVEILTGELQPDF